MHMRLWRQKRRKRCIPTRRHNKPKVPEPHQEIGQPSSSTQTTKKTDVPQPSRNGGRHRVGIRACQTIAGASGAIGQKHAEFYPDFHVNDNRQHQPPTSPPNLLARLPDGTSNLRRSRAADHFVTCGTGVRALSHSTPFLGAFHGSKCSSRTGKRGKKICLVVCCVCR